MTTEHFISPHGRQLAYRRFAPARSDLTYVWLCGFKSDITGSKVMCLEQWAKENGHGFLAFDYSGHGESGGAFEDGTISQWREDALDAIDGLTDGPLVLVGSSMGGWMALLSGLARRERLAGMVLIAPAPDFTEKLMWPEFTPRQQEEIMEHGLTLRPSDYGDPYPITKRADRGWPQLAAAGRADRPRMPRAHPAGRRRPGRAMAIRLPAGRDDEAADLVFTLIKDGDHRLSRDQDIARLLATCAEIAGVTNQ
jgi:pimeloyl-ACP methyl ester carboxylesterase